MSQDKSIITGKPVSAIHAPDGMEQKPVWLVEKFEQLIAEHGYDAYVDRALRCPCVDKTTGQALTTCKNCIGRGWFFVDRLSTKVISQSMKNLKGYQDWGEINRGTANITVRGSDKLGFMDRIIFLELETYYSEILRPKFFSGELVAFPVYEPISITNIFLFIGDDTKLYPLSPSDYAIKGNRITFDLGIAEYIESNDINQSIPELSVSIRYSYSPVYHVIDVNRELMKVRENKCTFSDEKLKYMPINVTAKKAHLIFDAQRFGTELLNNS